MTPSARRLRLPPIAGVCVDFAEIGAAPAGAPWALCRPVDLRETHGVEITLDRLREMAAAYDPVGVEAAALNYDHWRDGDAHGWLDRVWVDGDILWGTARDLSEDAADKIRTGARRRVSCEIDLKHEVTGGWYLYGLALLGATRAAVKGLPPIALADLGATDAPARRAYVWLAAERRLEARTITPTATTHPAAGSPADPPAGSADPTDQESTMFRRLTHLLSAPDGAPTGPQPPAAPAAPTPAAPATPTTASLATTPASPAPTPPATPAAPAAPAVDLAAQEQRVADRLASAERTLASAERTNRELLLRAARLDVDALLAGPLRGRLTPAQLRAAAGGITLQDALVQLRAAETPATIQLAAANGQPAREAGLYEVIVAALSAAPAFSALGAGQLATPAADATAALAADHRTAEQRAYDQAHGIKDETAIQLAARYPRLFEPPSGLASN